MTIRIQELFHSMANFTMVAMCCTFLLFSKSLYSILAWKCEGQHLTIQEHWEYESFTKKLVFEFPCNNLSNCYLGIGEIVKGGIFIFRKDDCFIFYVLTQDSNHKMYSL